MKCPVCKSDEIKTRRTFPGDPVKREKNCSCGHRFYTLEYREDALEAERRLSRNRIAELEREIAKIGREKSETNKVIRDFFALAERP